MKTLSLLHFTVIQPLYSFAINNHRPQLSSDLTLKLQVKNKNMPSYYNNLHFYQLSKYQNKFYTIDHKDKGT
jgi:hypothetical protein